MAVRWSEAALDDREALLEIAGRHAVLGNDRGILASALAADTRIKNEARQLDGPRSHIYDPECTGQLYTTRDRGFVLAYVRSNNAPGGVLATILHVWPIARDWPPGQSPARQGCRLGLQLQSFNAPSSGSLAA